MQTYIKEDIKTFQEELAICDSLIADYEDKDCNPYLDESGYKEMMLERALLIRTECLIVEQSITDVSYCEHWVCVTGEYLLGYNDEDELVVEINLHA